MVFRTLWSKVFKRPSRQAVSPPKLLPQTPIDCLMQMPTSPVGVEVSGTERAVTHSQEREVIMSKTPTKVFPKVGAAPTPKTPATAISPKAVDVKPAAKTAKPGGRIANLGDFAHPAKGKKKS